MLRALTSRCSGRCRGRRQSQPCEPAVIGHWLRRLRKRRGITAEGIAAHLGCGSTGVRRLERGSEPPPLWMMALYPSDLPRG